MLVSLEFACALCRANWQNCVGNVFETYLSWWKQTANVVIQSFIDVSNEDVYVAFYNTYDAYVTITIIKHAFDKENCNCWNRSSI